MAESDNNNHSGNRGRSASNSNRGRHHTCSRCEQLFNSVASLESHVYNVHGVIGDARDYDQNQEDEQIPTAGQTPRQSSSEQQIPGVGRATSLGGFTLRTSVSSQSVDHPVLGQFNSTRGSRPDLPADVRAARQNRLTDAQLITAQCMHCGWKPETQLEFVGVQLHKQHMAFNCPNQCVMNVEHHKEYYRCQCNCIAYDGIFYKGDLRMREQKVGGRLYMLGFGSIPPKSFVFGTKTTMQMYVDGAHVLESIAVKLAQMAFRYRVNKLENMFMYADIVPDRNVSHFADLRAEFLHACQVLPDHMIHTIFENRGHTFGAKPGTNKWRKQLYDLTDESRFFTLQEDNILEVIKAAETYALTSKLRKYRVEGFVQNAKIEAARDFTTRAVSRIVIQLPLNYPVDNIPTEGFDNVESESEPEDMMRQETYNRPQRNSIRKTVSDFLLSMDAGENVEITFYATGTFEAGGTKQEKLLAKYVGGVDCPIIYVDGVPYVSAKLASKQWGAAQCLFGLPYRFAYSSEGAVNVLSALEHLENMPADVRFHAMFRKAPNLTDTMARVVDLHRLERVILACTNFMDGAIIPTEGEVYFGDNHSVVDVLHRLPGPYMLAEPASSTAPVDLTSARHNIPACYPSRRLYLQTDKRTGQLPWNPPEEFYDFITDYNRYKVSGVPKPDRLHETMVNTLNGMGSADPERQQLIADRSIIGLKKPRPYHVSTAARDYQLLDTVLPKFRKSQCYLPWPYDQRVCEQLLEFNPFGLSDEQKCVVKGLMEPGSVVALQGMPGTGKTWTLVAAILTYIMSRHGYASAVTRATDGDNSSPLAKAANEFHSRGQDQTRDGVITGVYGTLYGTPETGRRPHANVIVIADSNEAVNNVSLALGVAIQQLEEYIAQKTGRSEIPTEGVSTWSDEVEQEMHRDFWNKRNRDFRYLRKFPKRYGPFQGHMNAAVVHQSNLGAKGYNMQNCDIILLTLGHARSFKALARCRPDLVVFEEASQTSFMDFLAFFGRFNTNLEDPSVQNARLEVTHSRGAIRNILIVGDVAQLPSKVIDPTADLPLMDPETGQHISEKDARNLIEEFKSLPVLQAASLQSVAFRHLPNSRKIQLTKLFRCQGSAQQALFEFTTQFFYNNADLGSVGLQASTLQHPLVDHHIPTAGPLLRTLLHASFPADFVLVNCEPPSGPIPEGETVRTNPTEASFIFAATKKLMLQGISSIGILSPYKDQIVMIKEMFSADQDYRDQFDPNLRFVKSNIRTVDSAQGREYDFCFLSFGRRDGRLKLLYDTTNPVLNIFENGRLNVATSRQKKALVMTMAVRRFRIARNQKEHNSNRGRGGGGHLDQDLRAAWGHKMNIRNQSLYALVDFLTERNAVIDAPRIII